MARRKKRREATPAKEPADTGFGSLADRLPQLSERAVAKERAAAKAAKAPPAPPPPKPVRKVAEKELMREAFDAVDDRALSMKYLGDGYRVGDDVEVVDPTKAVAPPVEVPASPDVTSDDLLFYELMTGVQPVEDRYAELREKDWAGARWHDERQLTRLTAEELWEPTLTAEQRDRLRRSRRSGAIPAANIRRMPKREALGEVEAFVRACVREDRRFARIVTGKGRGSADGPVLKPAVIAWCDTGGAELVIGWAPETDQSGQFGSVVLELRRNRQT